MSNIISLAEKRADRLKRALCVHARNGEPALIETRTGVIAARRIVCRESFAEVLDSAGDYFILDYADIRALRCATVTQTSFVNASGDFPAVQCVPSAPPSVAILPFARIARRR
ncbi:MAG: hypothetical protein AB7V13_16430 [Pseudorhodoplanes sp.]|uniref:hypothetical protein n=1 Tax=Pseudorhodoplanes sp. TaxID=1934341 RepID=UPI003D0E2FCD